MAAVVIGLDIKLVVIVSIPSGDAARALHGEGMITWPADVIAADVKLVVIESGLSFRLRSPSTGTKLCVDGRTGFVR